MNALQLWIRETKGSVIAFGAFFVLGMVSMGLLGAALYYPVAPVLRLRFPPQSQWHGDWVWPAVIGVGMAWSFGFLVAGTTNRWLLRRGWPVTLRWLSYLGILWLCALLIWSVCLEFSPVRLS